MSRRSGGGSRSSGGGRAVHVSGYTRSNGTYVQGYTRSSPSSGSSVSSASTSGSRTTQVASYTRSDGTHVQGYTRSVPSPSRSGSTSASVGSASASGSRTVQVASYTRSDGTQVQGHTRSVPSPSRNGTSSLGSARTGRTIEVSKDSSSRVSAKSSNQRCYVDNPLNRKLGRVGKPVGTQPVISRTSTCSGESTNVSGFTQRCYVDNAHNRRLGRAGKPIPKRRARQLQEKVEENTIQELVQVLQNLGFSDTCRPQYQYALDVLEREQVQETWKENNVNPATEISRLVRPTPGIIIPFAELRLHKRAIGHGAFGEVYAGLWHETPVAFKKLFYQQMATKRQDNFLREITILASLDHPNTVKMFGAVVEKGEIGIVMEYLPRSLFQAIFINETEFPDSKKTEIVHQMASALLYLHTREQKIAHCDVKSENVLLDKTDNVKLTDFGLSAVKNATESSQSAMAEANRGQGTPRYSAPEVLRGELLRMDQLLQTDVYSLAVVVFEVMVEEEPFEGLSVRQLEANVGRGSVRPTSAVVLSKLVQDLLDSCWQDSASKRPRAEEFLAKWEDISSLYET